MKDCCICIVHYKPILTSSDDLSFNHTISMFYGKYDIKVVLPDNIDLSYYKRYKKFIDIITIDNVNFKSTMSYNLMCTKTWFYDLFSDYEYMLIVQTDAWVYRDRLDYFLSLGFDYYGAPWPQSYFGVHNLVGNGGFCLRKVSTLRNICSKYEYRFEDNEDVWFCVHHKKELNICDLETACNFSIEQLRPEYLKMIKDVPFGVHGHWTLKYWNNESFWLLNK